tara:strand:- start:509 stop:880 length:372 start_codon:yes stop_codon:yes gene_type:complete
MKKIITAIAAIMFLFLLYEVKAGPPEDAKKFMIPFPVICTPGMSSMMSSLTTDYAVHISMTFEETPITGIIIMHNPNTQTAAVLHISEARVCLVFSGLNAQTFVRPEGMAPPKEQVQQDFKES